MAQVTVQQLAEVVGASVDRLLMQMKEADCHTRLPGKLCPMWTSRHCWPF